MLVAKYTAGPLKLFAGYEYIRYAAPSDPQAAFTDIAGNLLCLGCVGFNNTKINNTAFGVNGLGDKVFQVMWTEVKYSVTDQLDMIGGYYHYIQIPTLARRPEGLAPCSNSSHAQCAGTFDAISAPIDWRFAPKRDLYFGLMFSQVNGGLAFGFFSTQQHRSHGWGTFPLLNASEADSQKSKSSVSCGRVRRSRGRPQAR